jgi:uncharacterized protein YjlB
MSIFENIKERAERVTGIARPTDLAALVREKRPRLFHFKDDGFIPNHPLWPLILYRSAIRRARGIDPAAIFEDLFESNGWSDSWRDGIYPYVHYHSRIHEVLGIARGSAEVQLGGPRGRTLRIKAGDVVILPAGTGHQCLKASDDFLVVGAYPPRGTYDVCTSIRMHAKAVKTIVKVPRPAKDPVYGKNGALLLEWKQSAHAARRNRN